jgi:hypothetical protein
MHRAGVWPGDCLSGSGASYGDPLVDHRLVSSCLDAQIRLQPPKSRVDPRGLSEADPDSGPLSEQVRPVTSELPQRLYRLGLPPRRQWISRAREASCGTRDPCYQDVIRVSGPLSPHE